MDGDDILLALYLENFDNEGHKSIFAEVYRDYEQIMAKVAFKYLGDKHLAEDCVHNSFLELIKSFETFLEIDDSKRRLYIVTITKRCAIKIYNQEKKNSGMLYDSLLSETEVDIETTAFLNIDKEILINAIMNLSEKYSEPLILRYAKNYTYAEISNQLGIPEGTARQLVARAQKQLYFMLDEKENGK